jgi:hypothetical protein
MLMSAVAGYKLATGLFQYLEDARNADSLPDVLVTDNLTVVRTLGALQ